MMMMIDVQQKGDPGHQKLGMHCLCFICNKFFSSLKPRTRKGTLVLA